LQRKDVDGRDKPGHDDVATSFHGSPHYAAEHPWSPDDVVENLIRCLLERGRVMARPIVIHADWDSQAAVWVATTHDVRGLVTEADTIEVLRAKLPGIVFDLLEEQGISDFPVSIEIVARACDR
jgi:hypothetical protein